MSVISENIRKIRNNIGPEVSLVCVTKQVSVEDILEVISCGINIIGESRVEEALSKYDKLPKGISWHLVGHLQTRKVKDAVRIFDLIHSVDSLHLAQEINKRAGAIGKIQDILLEVNISGESTKYGFKAQDVRSTLEEIKNLPNVRVLGLMTMAPLVNDPELTRPIFRELKKMADDLGLKYLSMGMTQDYIVAIEEGANMVRIGTAIFGRGR